MSPVKLTIGQRLIRRSYDGTTREIAIEHITPNYVFVPHGRLNRLALEDWGHFSQPVYGCTWFTEAAYAEIAAPERSNLREIAHE